MCQKISDALCQYKSIRFIQVKNKKLACVYYTLLLLVLSYVIGFTIIYKKGYQGTDEVSGTTGCKIKGSGSIGNDTNFNDISELIPLDAMDLVRPSMEENAFFLTTSITTTTNQTQRLCDGHINDAPHCTVDDTVNCTEEFYSWDSQGIYTGECGTNNRCELYTWCPLENDSNIDIINNVGEFTVFVKIDVVFDKWNITRSNMDDRNGDGHPIFDYNLFKMNDILYESTNGVITDYKQIAYDGAIIMISSRWNCNFDYDEKYCQPKYVFQRIDSEPNTISSGFNYRTITYDINKKYRLLEKLHGIRVIFIIEGIGKKFDFAALTITFGAGLAYLSVATLITDFILEKFLPQSQRYVEFKHREIHDDQDEDNDDNPLESP